MKRRVMALFLVLTMLIGMAPAVFAAGTDFIDVSDTAWYAEAVNWAVENGITGGIGGGKFGPDNTCTRAQVVTFLWAAAGKPDPERDVNNFKDVNEWDYFYKAVLWAVENGITGGIGGGKFGSNDPCTRAQVATFLWRAQGSPDTSGLKNTFVDVSPENYFFHPVLWAVANEVTSGVGKGKFGPDNPCTRGQIALFLYKASQIVPGEEPEPEPDPPEEAVVLKVAFAQAMSNPEAQTLAWIAEELEARTDGRYKLEIHPDAELGDQAQTFEQITMGELDMAMVSNAVIETYISDFAILGTPYVFDSEEHLNKVLQSNAVDKLYKETKAQGFTVLSGYTLGARNVYTNGHSVSTPADLKGMKIRVMGSETFINMMNAMGGVGLAMAQGDVYAAIQTGTLDGAENNIVTYMDLAQYEVAPYYNKTNHSIIPDFLVIGNSVLDSMTKRDADILMDICAESIQVAYEKAAEVRSDYEAAAKVKGVTITECDVPAFQALCADLIYSVANRNELTRSTFDAIRALSGIEIPEPTGTIELTFSAVFQPEEVLGQAGEKLANMINERTDGAVKVTYYGQNMMDCYGDSVAQAVSGADWMGLEEPSLFADYVADCAVLVGPMLYASDEEYNYVMASELVQGIKERLASEHNIRILDTNFTFGFRSVYTNKVVTTPEDLNGLVLRATSSALFAKTLECLGATPQAMGFTEAISALSNGTLDGYEGSISTHKDTGVYEFVHNGALTNHLIAARWLFISESTWKKIPAEYQTIIEECAAECSKWTQEQTAAAEAEMIAFLEENGTVYNEVDLDAFAENCGPVFDWVVEEYGADPELLGKIEALVAAYREENPIVRYRVIFESNGGTPVTTAVVKPDCAVAEPAVPEKEGYVFTGWYTDEEITELYDFRTPVTADMVLYAGWSDDDNLVDDVIDIGDISYMENQGKLDVIYDEDGGVRTIDGRFTTKKVDSAADAAEVMNSASTLFGDDFNVSVNEVTYQSAGTGTDVEEAFYRYSPTVDDVEVLGSQVIVSADQNGSVTGMFSSYDDKIYDVDTYCDIEEEEAIEIAMSHLLEDEEISAFLAGVQGNAGDADAVTEAFLESVSAVAKPIIYAADRNKDPVLVYMVSVANYLLAEQDEEGDMSEDDTDEEVLTDLAEIPIVDMTYYIYANGYDCGEVFRVIRNEEGWSAAAASAKDLLGATRTFDCQEQGNKIRLKDTVRNLTTYKSTKGGLFWLESKLPGKIATFKKTKVNANAVSAHANMSQVYDYYLQHFGRDSFDDEGAEVVVSYNYGWNYDNAYWTPSGQQFVFGSGEDYVAALDIVGHEFTHAVINYVVGNGYDRTLNYWGESGALNEAYADIFGNLIENKSGEDFWNHGEDKGGVTRSMKNPTAYNQPDHYSALSDSEWLHSLNRYRDRDNEGVHIFSGVYCHAVYLMMVDSRCSDISRDQWAEVFYRSLSRLTENATFLDGRGAVLAAAKNLGFTTTQLQAIKDSFDQVGITPADEIRMVLTWGSNPEDLDAHLVGPTADGDRFHVYYDNKDYSAYDEETGNYECVTNLDYDDTDSFGPEVTTIHSFTAGEYYFYIHDYSNGNSRHSDEMARSGATVTLYIRTGSGDSLQRIYTVSPSSEGVYWNVFKLTIEENGQITVEDLNTYSYDQTYE